MIVKTDGKFAFAALVLTGVEPNVGGLVPDGLAGWEAVTFVGSVVDNRGEEEVHTAGVLG